MATTWTLYRIAVTSIHANLLLTLVIIFRREMYIGRAHMCVCVCVPRRIPTLLHGPGCKLGNGRGCPQLCTIRRICNRCTWEHSGEREMSASTLHACTRRMPGNYSWHGLCRDSVHVYI